MILLPNGGEVTKPKAASIILEVSPIVIISEGEQRKIIFVQLIVSIPGKVVITLNCIKLMGECGMLSVSEKARSQCHCGSAHTTQ
jgi:hypothetical protein